MSLLDYNVFLIGFMGTGKSTVASDMGDRYELQSVEMDETIASVEGKPISDIFAEYGEEYFRNLETSFLESMKEQKGKIVSCGGGVVLRDENVQLMKTNGVIVLLTASPEEILKRVANDEGRPLLRGRKNISAITELMEKRRRRYEEAADIIVCTDSKTASEISTEIMDELKIRKERE